MADNAKKIREALQHFLGALEDMIQEGHPAVDGLGTLFALAARRCREARGAWPHVATASPVIPLKQIRRELGKVIRAGEELNRLQDSIPLPPEEELEAMISGRAPVSEEAYVLALLQYSTLKLEAGAFGIREELHRHELKNPVWRSGWSVTDADIRGLLKTVKGSREFRGQGGSKTPASLL